MIILITGASHIGKTALAQKLLEAYNYPYLSIDHLKMGLIRSGNTSLTPMSNDDDLTAYLWPIVREMVKTAIENKQNLIVEGCYIPLDWAKDFEKEYLPHIQYYCLVMSENYIRNHFSDIKKYANIIEERLDDSDYTIESVIQDNERFLKLAQRFNVNYVFIDEEYEIDIDLGLKCENTNMNNLTIRLETKKDYRAVEELVREAFWNIYKPGADEHYYVHQMRNHPDFIPELAFVLEKEGKIIGNIMYTKAWLEDEKGNRKEILSFGPLCVAPAYQRQRLGKILIEHSFDVARKMGYDVNINFGNPGNYVSRGFVSCKKKNVSYIIDGNFPTALLVCELVPNALDGRKWMYIPSTAADCCEDVAAVEAFDATFPPKEKAWMPSQEEFYIYSHSSVVR